MDATERRIKGEAVRQADAFMLAALRAAGIRQADANTRDRITAYLLDRGYDIVPGAAVDWSQLSPGDILRSDELDREHNADA